jgi:hypothetical protein
LQQLLWLELWLSCTGNIATISLQPFIRLGFNMTEHNFKVRFIFKIGKVKEERWGNATVVGGTRDDAIKDVKEGYKRLGQKVLEIIPVLS